MKIPVHATLADLEDGDTIQGYKVKDLIIATEAAKKAGVTQEDLAGFLRNVENAVDFVRLEQNEALEQAMRNIGQAADFLKSEGINL